MDQSWVGSRLSLALDVIKEVQNAIYDGRITLTKAVIISQLSMNIQRIFLDFVIG